MNKFYIHLTVLILLIISPLHSLAHAQELTGTYLQKSCKAYQNLSNERFQEWDKEEALDNGIDMGFCGGFVASFMQTHKRFVKEHTATPNFSCTLIK